MKGTDIIEFHTYEAFTRGKFTVTESAFEVSQAGGGGNGELGLNGSQSFCRGDEKFGEQW